MDDIKTDRREHLKIISVSSSEQTQLLFTMLRVFVLVCLAAAVPIFASPEEVAPIVHTDLGDIRGSVQQTLIDNRKFYSFRGIRYAQSPTGELRFKVSKATRATNSIRKIYMYFIFSATAQSRAMVKRARCAVVRQYLPSTDADESIVRWQ